MLNFIQIIILRIYYTYYRLGRLKVRVLKEQEALQRRVALAANTGHDRNCKLGLISNIWRRILEIFP